MYGAVVVVRESTDMLTDTAVKLRCVDSTGGTAGGGGTLASDVSALKYGILNRMAEFNMCRYSVVRGTAIWRRSTSVVEGGRSYVVAEGTLYASGPHRNACMDYEL